jgi:excisionase family DNA binding protein
VNPAPSPGSPKEEAPIRPAAWPPVLLPEECGALLGLSRREVLDMARDQRLPCVRLGPKTVRFLRDSVIAHLARLERAALTDAEVLAGSRTRSLARTRSP